MDVCHEAFHMTSLLIWKVCKDLNSYMVGDWFLSYSTKEIVGISTLSHTSHGIAQTRSLSAPNCSRLVSNQPGFISILFG